MDRSMISAIMAAMFFGVLGTTLGGVVGVMMRKPGKRTLSCLLNASFLLFSFLLIGFDFLRAAANARAINFASNLGSVLFFIAIGEVDFSYSIPMGLSMIVGAQCGARMALAKGAAYVRPLFLIVTSVMIGKQVYTLICG